MADPESGAINIKGVCLQVIAVIAGLHANSRKFKKLSAIVYITKNPLP